MRCGRVLLLLVALLGAAHGVKILGLFGVSGKSHNNFFSALTTELSRRGHNVTVVTSFPGSYRTDNYREIAIDAMEKAMKSGSFSPFDHSDMSAFGKISVMLRIFLKMCPEALNDAKVRPLLDEKFDLVFVSTFFSHCFLPFGHYYGAPVIAISPSGSMGLGMNMANPEPTSYIPSIFLPFTSPMTFKERVINTLMTQLIRGLADFVYKPRMEAAVKEFFPSTIPSIAELERDISLVIYNNHFTLNGAKPMVPGVIEAGGMHIKQKNDPLPKDWQEYMDGAKEGVIYFSMGSVIKGSEIPEDKLKALLSAFAELPQKIIFKWEQDTMPGKPSNVKIGKWLPQQSILSHQNTKMFITHGGLLSTMEAAFHGVPLVGIPFFGDQQLNVAKSARMGLAVALDFKSLTKESILDAVTTILKTPLYYKNAKDLQSRVRDQPQSPLAKAVFWTEYVIRHKGATHMRSAATDMPWWQVHLIDVYAAIFGALFAILYIEWKLIKWCCCRKGKSTVASTSGTKRNKNVKAKMQ